MITSELEAPTPPRVDQTDRHNAVEGDRPVLLPNVAGGDASRHILTPNMLLAMQNLDVAEDNIGLGGDIGNPYGSDNWDAFLSASGEGFQVLEEEKLPASRWMMFNLAHFSAIFTIFQHKHQPPPASPMSIDGA